MLNKLKSANKRTQNILIQSGFGLAFRLASILATFASMPILQNELGSDTLGTWLVLLSIPQWLTYFDFGIASGARNEMAHSAAQRDDTSTRKVLTTGWIYTLFISLFFVATISVIMFVTTLPEFVTRSVFKGNGTTIAIGVVAFGSCLVFLLNYIQIVYAAHQQSSIISAFSAIANILFLLFLLSSKHFVYLDINIVSVAYISFMIIANTVLIYSFFKSKPQLIPRLDFFEPKLRDSILGFGIRIFIIQIAALVIYTTSRIMISIFGQPSDVVIYDSAFKIFSLVSLFYGILMGSLWSNFTHAKSNNDWPWIKQIVNKLMLLNLPIALFCIILVPVSPSIISSWMGEANIGSTALYVYLAIFTISNCWSNLFAMFLNGIGDTSVQFGCSLIAALSNIPLSYYFSVYLELGVEGVALASVVSTALFPILGFVYSTKLIRTNYEKSQAA